MPPNNSVTKFAYDAFHSESLQPSSMYKAEVTFVLSEVLSCAQNSDVSPKLEQSLTNFFHSSDKGSKLIRVFLMPMPLT